MGISDRIWSREGEAIGGTFGARAGEFDHQLIHGVNEGSGERTGFDAGQVVSSVSYRTATLLTVICFRHCSGRMLVSKDGLVVRTVFQEVPRSSAVCEFVRARWNPRIPYGNEHDRRMRSTKPRRLSLVYGGGYTLYRWFLIA
jgi:hypothetical protein